MKGMVFNLLNELVENEFGFETWDAVLEKANPKSEGIYTSGAVYEDSEMVDLVTALSEELNTSVPDLLRAFGSFMIGKFAGMHPEFFQTSAKEFLKSVHDIIHVEVRKLHDGVILPDFDYEDPGLQGLVMLYSSPRKMCHLAEGLIQGTSKHFETPIIIAHTACMHDGQDHCRLELEFG